MVSISRMEQHSVNRPGNGSIQHLSMPFVYFSTKFCFYGIQNYLTIILLYHYDYFYFNVGNTKISTSIECFYF